MANKKQVILVTGAAGFIGFHLSKKLLEMGERVVGVDNLNSYYDVNLKKARLEILKSNKNFGFYKEDIQNLDGLKDIFRQRQVKIICNLAAQAGVRHSLKDPFSYQKSNLEGFLNLLELARKYKVKNFVYASSSSIYGNNKNIPFSVDERVDTPISLYAATKKANELIAHAYSHLYQIPCTGLRYFTVYGPWGRPDMALFLFTDAILKIAALKRPVPYEIFNLGNSDSVHLLDFIHILEEELGQEAEKNMMPMQPGDVAETAADIQKSKKLLGFNPKTPLREGIKKFVAWYRQYYLS
jgi:UDP-glucuronate 4-epimerase